MTDTIKLPNILLSAADIDARWADGPFYGIKLLPAKAKGKRFEQIAEFILNSRGNKVDRPTSSDHDRIINGVKSEIKGSTITKGSDGVFSFLQIRPQQDYEQLVLETFWFDGTIKFYRIPKDDVIAFVELGVFKKQHGGNRAESGTYCYNGTLEPFKDHFWFEVKVDG